MSNEGPQPKETEIERLVREVNAEANKWVEEGMGHPKQVFAVDQLEMLSAFDALKEMLIEAGVFTQEEFDIRKYRHMLATLKRIRDEMQPQLEEQRRNSLIVRQMPSDGHLPFERN